MNFYGSHFGNNADCNDIPRGVEDFFSLKEEGNRFARNGDFPEAIESYTKCVEMLLPSFEIHQNYNNITNNTDRSSRLKNSLIGLSFSNRSQMYFMMGEYYKSFLDCLSVFESIIIRSHSSDAQCLFSTFNTGIMIKTRIRIARILCISSRNYPTAHRYLNRTTNMNDEKKSNTVSEDWKKKIFDEMMTVGDKFYQRVHNYQDEELEKQKGFHKFCVNSKSLREIPIRMNRRNVYEKLKDRRFSSYSKKGTKIYVFGGRSRDKQHKIHYYNELYVLDTQSLSIEKINNQSCNIPFKRSQHRTVIHNNFLYLFGGDNYSLSLDNNHLHPFFHLNLRTMEWKKLPFPIKDELFGYPLCLFDHSMIVHKDEIFIYGGCSRIGSLDILQFREHGSLYSYNINTKKWCILSKYQHDLVGNAKIPGARFNQALWKMVDDENDNLELFMFGGCVAEDSEMYPKNKFFEDNTEKISFYTYGDLWCFDVKNLKWSPVIQNGCIPSRRSEIKVIVDDTDDISSKAYLFGGYSYQGIIRHPLPGVLTGVEFYSYFCDLYEFSFHNRVMEGNELFGHNGILKDLKQCYWRKVLYNRTSTSSSDIQSNSIPNNFFFEPRSQIFPFFDRKKRKMYIWGGYQGGKRKELLTFWDKLVEITFVRKKGCAHCLKKVKKMMKCSRCGERYCGRECQKKNWLIVHKKRCGKK